MSTHSLADTVLPKRMRDELERIFDANNKKRSGHFRQRGRNGIVSLRTQHLRRDTLRLCFAQLWQGGFRMKSPRSLGDKHVRFLVDLWDKQGLSAMSMHTRISNLNTFAVWIGKPGLVRPPAFYLPAERVKRTHIATESRAWGAAEVNPEEIIAKATAVDERLGLMLALQHHLMMRVKESIELRPLVALQSDGKTIELFEGTKGGKRRSFVMTTPEQYATFNWAVKVAKRSRSGRIRWPGKTFNQAYRRFYDRLERKLGVTKSQLGITPHGLRHGGSQRMYREITGFPTPVEGGALGEIDPQLHRWATLKVAGALGHVRPSITASYCGSYGHQLRIYKVAALEFKPGAFNLKHKPMEHDSAEQAPEVLTEDTPS